MKFKILSILLLVVMFSFVSAESIGDNYELNQSMQITNYCQAGVCTFVTLDSIEFPNGTIIYPNINMTKNSQSYNFTFIPDQIGTYYFTTCGDSTIAVCDRDMFGVNFNGVPAFIGIHIILLIFFLLLFVGFYKLQRSLNFDKWYSKIMKRYEGKDYFKAVGGTMIYFFMKNLYSIYYILGLFVVLTLTDMILSFNVVSFIFLIEQVAFVYTWASIGVSFAILGRMQQFIMMLLSDLNDQSWGLVNDLE